MTGIFSQQKMFGLTFKELISDHKAAFSGHQIPLYVYLMGPQHWNGKNKTYIHDMFQCWGVFFSLFIVAHYLQIKKYGKNYKMTEGDQMSNCHPTQTQGSCGFFIIGPIQGLFKDLSSLSDDVNDFGHHEQP